MKPLIIGNEKNNFDVARLRKNIKGALELNDFSYAASIYDESYKIAHFVSLEDFRKNRSELIKGTKVVLSLFYCEEDNDGCILKNKKDQSPLISVFDMDLINKADLILVPSDYLRTYLISCGIKIRIDVFSSGVNVSKFSIKNTYIRNIAYRYFKCSEDFEFAISILDYDDVDAFKRIKIIASLFPKIKFVGITDFKYISRLVKKEIKKIPSNLIISNIIDENVYLSLIFNSIGFLFINSYKGDVLQYYEAMASETQILALKSSVYQDLIIDKENGYVYNDFDSLINGFTKLLNNELVLTTKKAKAISIENSLKKVGEKLINIYKGL